MHKNISQMKIPSETSGSVVWSDRTTFKHEGNQLSRNKKTCFFLFFFTCSLEGNKAFLTVCDTDSVCSTHLSSIRRQVGTGQVLLARAMMGRGWVRDTLCLQLVSSQLATVATQELVSPLVAAAGGKPVAAVFRHKKTWDFE